MVFSEFSSPDQLKPTYFAYLDTRENSLDRRPRLSNRT